MHRWFWRTLRPLYGSRTVMTGQHSTIFKHNMVSQHVMQLPLQVRCAGLIYLRFVVPPAKLFDKPHQLGWKQLWKFESNDTSILNDFHMFEKHASWVTGWRSICSMRWSWSTRYTYHNQQTINRWMWVFRECLESCVSRVALCCRMFCCRFYQTLFAISLQQNTFAGSWQKCHNDHWWICRGLWHQVHHNALNCNLFVLKSLES